MNRPWHESTLVVSRSLAFALLLARFFWVPSLCAENVVWHYPHIFYSNDCACVVLTTTRSGWIEWANPWYFRSEFWAEYSSAGEVPLGLHVITVDERFVYPGTLGLYEMPANAKGHDYYDYTVTSYILSGLVTGASVRFTPVRELTCTKDEFCNTYILDPDTDDWLLQSTEHNNFELHYHFYCDDYADEPANSNHVGNLAVQSQWSVNNGWVEGYLYREATLDEYEYVPADVDVFRLDAGPGVYCVETRCTQAGGPALDIAVLKKKVDNNAYDGEPIAWTNDFNVYNAQGQLDGLRQRVYCTLTNDNGAYVRLTSRDPHNVVDYSVRVFRARPVILVHGIESHPLDDQDEESTLGHFALVAPWDAAMPPCQAYAFPWNSKQNNIEMDTNVGIGFAFVNYVNGTYAKHGATPAVLIGHSMGGYLCRIYMHGEESALRWSHCFLLSSPQYGSDIANAVPGCISRSWWSQTSAYNIQALRRGSEHVRIMIEWSGDIGAKVICIAGTDSNFSKYDWKLATAVNMNAFYHNGLHQSDCVVPNSSALLANARCLTVPMNHHRIGVFTDHEDSTDPRNTMRDAVYQHIRNILIE